LSLNISLLLAAVAVVAHPLLVVLPLLVAVLAGIERKQILLFLPMSHIQ
jgi:hypothetical protein